MWVRKAQIGAAPSAVAEISEFPGKRRMPVDTTLWLIANLAQAVVASVIRLRSNRLPRPLRLYTRIPKIYVDFHNFLSSRYHDEQGMGRRNRTPVEVSYRHRYIRRSASTRERADSPSGATRSRTYPGWTRRRIGQLAAAKSRGFLLKRGRRRAWQSSFRRGVSTGGWAGSCPILRSFAVSLTKRHDARSGSRCRVVSLRRPARNT